MSRVFFGRSLKCKQKSGCENKNKNKIKTINTTKINVKINIGNNLKKKNYIKKQNLTQRLVY
jgi:hypothetical protein